MAVFSSHVSIHIAMLNADIPVPNVLARHGSYGNIFLTLLQKSAARLFPAMTSSEPAVRVTSQDFDVVRGEYPSSLDEFDAILLTGSAASSYEDNQWNRDLDSYVSHVYKNQPSIKIFGSCFGHQMVCQSLLREHGAVVEKSPAGWELGVFEISTTDGFQKAFQTPVHSRADYIGSSARPGTPDTKDAEAEDASTGKASSLRLQFIHADHVRLGVKDSAPVLPPNWMVIGDTDKCAVQGVYEPGRVLTYQGHFEFDRFINTETLKVFGAKWDAQFFQESLKAMDRDDDAEAACDAVLRFFLQGRQTAQEGLGGLMTPPLCL